MTPRLTADFRVKALVRHCLAHDLFAAVRHRGDGERGGLLIKIDRFAAGCRLLEPVSDPAGATAWRDVAAPPVDAARAEDLIARRRRVDRDLWVVEVEDPSSAFDPADLPA